MSELRLNNRATPSETICFQKNKKPSNCEDSTAFLVFLTERMHQQSFHLHLVAIVLHSFLLCQREKRKYARNYSSHQQR